MKIDPTKLCQIEIMVSDVERSLRFYENVFGWRKLPCDLHEYIVLEVPDHCPFGISLIPRRVLGAVIGKIIKTTSIMVPYFKTEHPQEIAAHATEFGGKVRFGPKTLPSYGEIWQIEDPDGQRIGLVKEKMTATEG